MSSALHELLAHESDPQVVGAALLALAKLGFDPAYERTLIENYLSHASPVVVESAVLSLGILGSPDAAPVLLDLFHGRSSRAPVDVGGTSPWRTKAFAVFGLGLLAARASDSVIRDDIQAELIDFVSHSTRADPRDVRAAAVLALGWIPDPKLSAVAVLEAYVAGNCSREEVLCAHAVNSIARLAANARSSDRLRYCDKFLDELSLKSTSRYSMIRSSMAQGVGILARADEPNAARALAVLRERIDTEVSKNFSLAFFGLMALGHIAGTGEPGSAIESYLLDKAMASGGRIMTRSWAALALGVEGALQHEREVVPSSIIGECLRSRLLDIKDPQQSAAFALGLGLRRDFESIPVIESRFMSVRAHEFRGYFLTSLGFLEDRRQMPTIQSALASHWAPGLMREASVAVELLGRDPALASLLDVIERSPAPAPDALAAAANAIGNTGGLLAVEPLLQILRRTSGSTGREARSYAAAALGILCDKDASPWNATLAADLNYLVTTDTMNDQASQCGLFNLL